MQDFFHEEMIKRNAKNALPAVQSVATVFVCLFSLIGGVDALYRLLHGDGMGYLIRLIIYAGFFVLAYRYRDILRVEYEYSLTNHELDIARITGKRRRKECISADLRMVLGAGVATHRAFVDFDKQPGVKRHNCYVNPDTPHYFLFFDKQGSKHMVVFEPSQKLVECMKKSIPRDKYHV